MKEIVHRVWPDQSNLGVSRYSNLNQKARSFPSCKAESRYLMVRETRINTKETIVSKR